MWAKLAQLFFRRPDLLLNHIEAYAQQAGREIHAAKQSLSKALLGLVLGAFLFALALALLAFALMLDSALPVVTERFWLYAAPAALLALALQRHSAESELKRQAQADFALLRALAQKKTEG